MSQLQDNLNEILRQKNQILTPSNVKSGVTYLGQTGEYNGTLSTIQSQMVIADWYKFEHEGSEEDFSMLWQKANLNIYFRLPYDIGSNKYICGITPNPNGGYSRWLIVYRSNIYAGIIDFDAIGSDYDGDYAGTNIDISYVIKSFKFADINSLQSVVNNYGQSELGVECNLTDLDVFNSSTNQIILSGTGENEIGYFGQNQTTIYHTPYGEVSLYTDILDTKSILIGTNVYDGKSSLTIGNFTPPFKTINCKGISFSTNIANITQPLPRTTDMICVLPSGINLAGKYYIIVESFDNMMERYEHSANIIVSDKEMILHLGNNYAFSIGQSAVIGTDGYLFLTTSTKTAADYTWYNVKNTSDTYQNSQLPFNTIFTSTDVNWPMLSLTQNYTTQDITYDSKWESNTISYWYDTDGYHVAGGSSSSIGHFRSDMARMGQCRLITNCQIQGLDAAETIILSKLLMKQDIGTNQQFIDIDGSVVTGTATTILTPTEVETAENTVEEILGNNS